MRSVKVHDQCDTDSPLLTWKTISAFLNTLHLLAELNMVCLNIYIEAIETWSVLYAL